ncbi:MAG: hypothetical protein SOS98_02230 [Varibaculum sp.]|nr:hypothetical protein [Varibaculum sp.]
MSNISFILEFDESNKKRMELLDYLAVNGSVGIDRLMDEADDDLNEFVEFLLNEHILTPENEEIPEMYYGLLDGIGNAGNSDERNNNEDKILILTSSEKMKDNILYSMDGMDCVSEVKIYHGEDIELDSFSYVCAIYEYYAPDIFHKLNYLTLKADCPLQISYLDGSAAYISPIFIRNVTVCYNEMEIQLEAAITHDSEYRAYKNYLREKDREIMPYPNFIVSMLSFNSLHLYFDFKISRKLKTKNRVLIFDMESMRYDLADLFPMPNCPACKSENKMVHDYL